MINLAEMQKAAEGALALRKSGGFDQNIWTEFYDQCEPENISKLIEIARASKRAWELLNVIRPRSPETDNLFRALEGIE